MSYILIAEIPKSAELLLLPIELILPVLGVLLIRTESPIRGLIYRSFLGSLAALIYAVVGAPDVALTEVLVGTLLSAILYIITIRACYTIIIIKRNGYILEKNLRNEIESIFQELHLQVKYENKIYESHHINYQEIMSSSTMTGSPHAVLDENGLYIESELLLEDLQEKIKERNFGVTFNLLSQKILPDELEVAT
mgnify:FL=1